MNKTIIITLLLIANTLVSYAQDTISVCTTKTVHLTFPTKVRYVDLGSSDLLASLVQGADNIIRIKASRPFSEVTNLSIVCEDGSFFSFIASYNETLSTFFYELKDPINYQNEILFTESGSESPSIITAILKNIADYNKNDIRTISFNKERIRATVTGIYVYSNMMYIRVSITNNSNLPYNIDFTNFIIKDRGRISKQTASQEKLIDPIRVSNNTKTIGSMSTQVYVYAFPITSLSRDKMLEIIYYEKTGGRNISLEILSQNIISAKKITNINL